MPSDTAEVSADAAQLAAVLAASLGPDLARTYADRLFERFGTLAAVFGAPATEVKRVLGPNSDACAETVKSLNRLVIGVLKSAITDRPLVASARELHDYLRASLAHERREQFRVLHLDAGLHLIADELGGEGTIDQAPVYPREVIRRALELGSKHLLLVHNHPSGKAEPSRADIEMTRQIMTAAMAMGLEVVDHLIVAKRLVTSLRDLGYIGPEGSLGPLFLPRPGRPRRVAAA